MSRAVERTRTILRILLALVYLYVGIAHLRSPNMFLAIIPLWVPFPYQVILFTGLCEIVGSVALLTQRLRRAAGIMLALYAICVFPANIRHAVEGIAIGGKALGWGYHGPRLLFQPVFVWWALFAGGAVNWPFKPKTGIR
jgi:uncharacterized membrane protein